MNCILFPTDFSEVSKNALNYTHQLAKNLDAHLTVMHTHQPERSFRDFLLSRKRKNAVLRRLLNFTEKEQTESPGEISLMVRKGLLEEQVVRACQSGSVRYIAVGKKHSYNSFQRVLGTKTSRIISKAYCPVLVIPSHLSFKPFKNILIVGGKYRHLDNVVQENVLSLSLRFGANLHYININNNPMTWEFNKELINRQNFLVQKSIPEDCAVESLAEYIQEQEIDLMVMLTNRRELFEDLFQFSYQNKTLDQTDVPLLVFHTHYLNWRREKEVHKPLEERLLRV